VHPLVTGVSSSVHESYSRLDDAVEAYSNVFSKGQLIVITPWGEIMGPPSGAIYVESDSSDKGQGDASDAMPHWDGSDKAQCGGGSGSGSNSIAQPQQGEDDWEVSDKWIFSDSELEDLAILDQSFDAFYRHCEE